MGKVLIAGESWIVITTHIKGFDSMITSSYEEEGVFWLKKALEDGGYDIDYMPNHLAPTKFPQSADEFSQYSLIILSDIGSNTLLLHPDTFLKGQATSNRCELIRDFVLNGGALCMVGGYMSFTGFDAKARYGSTSVKDILPVDLLKNDDRYECPESVKPIITELGHPIFNGIPIAWPGFLGYNKTIANYESGNVLATINGDPFLAVGEFGKGRSAAFTSDCCPHWATMDFVNWEYYGTFWVNLAKWLTGDDRSFRKD